MAINVSLNDFEISPFGVARESGVYAIWASNSLGRFGIPHLLYIGSSQNMAKRIYRNQHPYMIAFNRLSGMVYASYYETKNYLELERLLIEQYRPIMNKRGKV